MTGFAFRQATFDDILFIMATERLAGHDRIVGRWEAAQHRAEMTNAASAYFLGEMDGTPAGFAIVLHRDEPSGNVLLKRIAVAAKGHGVGRAILRAVTGAVFDDPHAHRFWLTVMPYNAGARHLYASEGFTEEGVLREAALLPDGTRADQIVMSLLREEYEARPPLPLRERSTSRSDGG